MPSSISNLNNNTTENLTILESTAHGVLIGEASSPVAYTAVGATGTFLGGNTGADPSFQAIPGTFSNSFVTDSGTATPSAGVLDINGAHNVNTSGSGNQLIVHGNNTITVGDLASVAGADAITVTTGNVTVTAGNLNLPNTNMAGTLE